MKNGMKNSCVILMMLVGLILNACGGGGGDDPVQDNDSCPSYNLGDSMTYLRTEIDSRVSSHTTSTFVVTERTADSVSLGDGMTTKTYAIVDGQSIPESETGTIVPDDYYTTSVFTSITYTSTTSLCPPAAVGESYEYETFVPGPWEGTGEFYSMTLSVTGISIESISTPAGAFTAKKIVMDYTVLHEAVIQLTGIVTTYYVGGVGVVKEVTEIPSTNTTIIHESTSYSFDGPAMGTADNPIIISGYSFNSTALYSGRVGTGALYIKLVGLVENNNHTIDLTTMSDNADLYVYSDAFTTLDCSPLNTGTLDETCNATTSATGELYIKIDGSLTGNGTFFAIAVEP